ncbi:hypothetical protein Q7P36_002315 [Cladosporium allicinum]
MHRLFVNKLSPYITEDTLRSEFKQHGKVAELVSCEPNSTPSANLGKLPRLTRLSLRKKIIVRDRESGMSRGFAFVSFESIDEANSAIKALDGVDRPATCDVVTTSLTETWSCLSTFLRSSPIPQHQPQKPLLNPAFYSTTTEHLIANMSTKVFINNIPDGVDEMVLRPVVEEHGEVKDISLPRDHDTGKLRGFGSITYADAKSVKGAIKKLDGSELNGQSLEAKEFDEKLAKRGGWS